MEKSSLIIITLCVAATLAFSAITQKIIKHYDLGGIGSGIWHESPKLEETKKGVYLSLLICNFNNAT
jgi:hypothetical protein